LFLFFYFLDSDKKIELKQNNNRSDKYSTLLVINLTKRVDKI
jgi:hypothetical protein